MCALSQTGIPAGVYPCLVPYAVSSLTEESSWLDGLQLQIEMFSSFLGEIRCAGTAPGLKAR